MCSYKKTMGVPLQLILDNRIEIPHEVVEGNGTPFSGIPDCVMRTLFVRSSIEPESV